MNTYVCVIFVHDHSYSYCSLSFIDVRVLSLPERASEQGNVIGLVSVYRNLPLF